MLPVTIESYLALSMAERVIRLIFVIMQEQSGGFKEQNIWSSPLYQAFYYLRFLAYPIYYGALLDMSIRLAHPDYYRAAKWLK